VRELAPAFNFHSTTSGSLLPPDHQTRLGENYTVVPLLGQGGMRMVYRGGCQSRSHQGPTPSSGGRSKTPKAIRAARHSQL